MRKADCARIVQWTVVIDMVKMPVSIDYYFQRSVVEATQSLLQFSPRG